MHVHISGRWYTGTSETPGTCLFMDEEQLLLNLGDAVIMYIKYICLHLNTSHHNDTMRYDMFIQQA